MKRLWELLAVLVALAIVLNYLVDTIRKDMPYIAGAFAVIVLILGGVQLYRSRRRW